MWTNRNPLKASAVVSDDLSKLLINILLCKLIRMVKETSKKKVELVKVKETPKKVELMNYVNYVNK